MLSILVVSQIVFFVATEKSAYVHHLIAIAVTVGVVWLLDRRTKRERRCTSRLMPGGAVSIPVTTS